MKKLLIEEEVKTYKEPENVIYTCYCNKQFGSFALYDNHFKTHLVARHGLEAKKSTSIPDYTSKSLILKDKYMKKRNLKVMFSSAKDNYKTPTEFYQALDAEFGFDFDPCPLKQTFDGLSIEWGGCNFVNPPYSQIKDWIKKGYEEHLKGKTVVFLIPSRTDTRWWHEYIMKAKEIRFIKGRLKFGDSKNSAPFPSAIVIYE